MGCYNHSYVGIGYSILYIGCWIAVHWLRAEIQEISKGITLE